MDDIIVVSGGITGVSIVDEISKFLKPTLLERDTTDCY